MLTNEDRLQCEAKGISPETVEQQLARFQKGFPYLRLLSAAAVGDGITTLDAAHRQSLVGRWEAYKAQGHHITKFVPASGAATRMFKDMFDFLNAPYDEPTTAFEKQYFGHITRFAFYPALDDACHVNCGMGVEALMAEGRYKDVVENMLGEEGLGYGQLPKGLLQFHDYADEARTPVEEHLVEAAQYASSNGVADVHFTVSGEHRAAFEELLARVVPAYETTYGVKFNVGLSEQKPDTDTVAANADNTPFRTEEGRLLFRPGGHGALIQNLSDLESEIVFIKNIDNVVPDRLKADMVSWKQSMAGLLVQMQQRAFEYLRLLDSGKYGHEEILDIIDFVLHDLQTRREDLKDMEDAELVNFLRTKLNRPMRVCGVVKNEGEAGGGPFLAYNSDGSTSPQILESSQIDPNNAAYQQMFREGTHFNPVDLVCAIRDYKGGRFSLPLFADPETGFISHKSKNGRELKALELPGLWNGAMSDWSTIFVEVPVSTFNPVKSVNDLLRPQHLND